MALLSSSCASGQEKSRGLFTPLEFRSCQVGGLLVLTERKHLLDVHENTPGSLMQLGMCLFGPVAVQFSRAKAGGLQ